MQLFQCEPQHRPVCRTLDSSDPISIRQSTFRTIEFGQINQQQTLLTLVALQPVTACWLRGFLTVAAILALEILAKVMYPSRELPLFLRSSSSIFLASLWLGHGRLN